MAVASQVGSVTFVTMMLYSIILVLPMIWLSAAEYADKPCKARSNDGKSVTCVCTEDYCDTVIRETPASGHAMLYSSSEGGKRFNKSSIALVTCDETATADVIVELNPEIVWQTIKGFGGCITDATALNYASLNNTKLKKHFIESYCSNKGLEYSMLRIPIGGTEFSTRGYGYNMLPVNDTALSNFSLAYEDTEYKIPLIKACMKKSNHSSIKMLASLWSPPAWMKTNNAYNGFGWLKEEYYQTLADYFYKFMKAYKKKGISMWGVTITNEPINGIATARERNSLGWTIDQMNKWLTKHLSPTLRNSTSDFKDVLILANDDNRQWIPLFYNLMLKTFPEFFNHMDGVAVHSYDDDNVPPTVLQKCMAKSPNRFLLTTEGSIIPSKMGEDPVVAVDYGSWNRAEKYINYIMENLNYNSTGWMDLNMALNTEGGPSWLDFQQDAPIIVDADAGEFIKQPMYYAMGHFSKFIPPGASRINATMSSDNGDVQNVAFITPSDTIVAVVYNAAKVEKSVSVRLNGNEAAISLGARTITTVEFPSC